ncbi:hypothetical protein SAI_1633 [Streptococcus agalactiae H36B]|nr:hypothetical protein SAI_1633 [Streptococcus agalactiae H36B]
MSLTYVIYSPSSSIASAAVAIDLADTINDDSAIWNFG